MIAPETRDLLFGPAECRTGSCSPADCRCPVKPIASSTFVAPDTNSPSKKFPIPAIAGAIASDYLAYEDWPIPAATRTAGGQTTTVSSKKSGPPQFPPTPQTQLP